MLVKVEACFDGESWFARGIGEDIFTQGSTLDELFQNIQEAVALHFGDTTEPITILTSVEEREGSSSPTVLPFSLA
jgi:hypothetical protein